MTSRMRSRLAWTIAVTSVLGLSDRLDAIGGRLEIRSAPRQGTEVTGVIAVGAGEATS
jgi:hypothetical protein